jgi:hypothetical protein
MFWRCSAHPAAWRGFRQREAGTRGYNAAVPAHIFDSVDDLLSPQGLGRVLGARVDSIERSPLKVEHYSGNTLEAVGAMRDGKPVRFVLKRFSYERDWVMRRTHDTRVRESALYREGVYARFPEQCRVPVIATARDGDSWATLMDEVGAWLAPLDAAPIPLADLEGYLRGLAAFHTRFLGDESLAGTPIGLSSLVDFISILSPEGARREIEAGGAGPVLERCVRGWEIFAESAPPAAVRIVSALHRDPAPLVEALRAAPSTLVHGDYKLANLGQHGGQTVILDWQDAAFGPPLLDLGYFLAIHAARLPVSKEETAERYRAGLGACGYRYPEHGWERDLALGLLAGGAMRLMWLKALGAASDDPAVRALDRAELGWWAAQIVRAARWVG